MPQNKEKWNTTTRFSRVHKFFEHMTDLSSQCPDTTRLIKHITEQIGDPKPKWKTYTDAIGVSYWSTRRGFAALTANRDPSRNGSPPLHNIRSSKSGYMLN
eukprot:GEZU01023319.1.p1 GENE.GEZU01023319.1~~GEZU01023319.1.p1  ORF type:complete len:101 (+),score=1.44 GEZU01023319.1:107-409(+)